MHGLVKGSALTTWRILRCNPFSKGGADEVKPGPRWLSLSKHGFVFARLETVSIEKDK